MLLEKVDGCVEIGDAVLEILIRCAAEFLQISRARDPIMPARVDDKTMITALCQCLAEVEQRRQIKIHRHAMDENQAEIGYAARRRKQRTVQPFVVGGFESVDLGVVVHK